MQENARITTFNTWLFTLLLPLFPIHKQFFALTTRKPKRMSEFSYKTCWNKTMLQFLQQ